MRQLEPTTFEDDAEDESYQEESDQSPESKNGSHFARGQNIGATFTL